MPQSPHRRHRDSTARRERASLVVACLSLMFSALSYLAPRAQHTDPTPTDITIYLPQSTLCHPSQEAGNTVPRWRTVRALSGAVRPGRRGFNGDDDALELGNSARTALLVFEQSQGASNPPRVSACTGKPAFISVPTTVGAVEPITEREIRASFVNCSQGEAKRLNVPTGLADTTWDELDYLGWRDPKAPARGYLVAALSEGLVGLTLRAPAAAPGAKRAKMCSLCMTPRSGGVSLMVAPRVGRSGLRGNTVGTYICSELNCSLYVRGRLAPGGPIVAETITLEERIARLVGNLEVFVARVRAPR